MKFMSRLLLWQRLFLLGLLSLILAGIPFYLYLTETQKTLDFALDEQRGLIPLKLILNLYKAIQDDRGLAVQLLNGIETVAEKRDAKQEEINKLVLKLSEIAEQESWNNNILNSWQLIKGNLEQIATTIAQRSVSATETRQQHNTAIANLHLMRQSIAEHYKLSLDPEVSSSHIVKALVYNIVQLSDPLGLIRGSGADVLFRAANAPPSDVTAKTATDAERINLIQKMELAQEGLKGFVDSIKDAVADNDELRLKLTPDLQLVINTTTTAIKLTNNEIIHAQVVNYDFTNYRTTISTAIDNIDKFNKEILTALNDILQDRVYSLQNDRLTVIYLLLAITALGAIFAFFIVRSILKPVEHLVDIMRKLAKGNFNARANIDSHDEIGQLASHFNRMVNEREAFTTAISNDNEQLNNSVILLLKAVARLSQRDLTVQIPVAPDLTGPLSDALNLLTSEMAKALRHISQISEEVTQASISVQEQANLVASVAKNEKEQVEKTAVELDHAALTMLNISKLAQSTNVAADKATHTTQNALSTVAATVEGIERTRETIREAGTRIERLGIHSQEISSVVDLIGGIARRTQILAVSASMHAASAGEAGQGFQIIANEVQRLAETAQQAAAKIGTLLANIQGEVTDTVTTMNNVIKQVIESSKLAGEAGEQMRLTQRTTADLVASVQIIAESSEEQAQASTELLNRAHNIRKSTQLTSKQLKSQTIHTENLVRYANNLLAVVQVFKLPN